MALSVLEREIHSGMPLDRSILAMPIETDGTSLLQNWRMANARKLNLQMAHRETGQEWSTPAMVHLSLGHFVAVIQKRDGMLLVRDSLFGGERWIHEATLNQESSGYALIPNGQLPVGWHSVSESEAARIWAGDSCGGGTAADPHAPVPENLAPACTGMPVAQLNTLSSALLLNDIPVSYTPPRGQKIALTLTYNSKNADQPATYTYSNLGPKWAFDWVLTLTDDPTTVGQTVKLLPASGGMKAQVGYNTLTQTYAPDYFNQDQLVRTSASSYKVVHRDGSSDIYDLTDGAIVAPRTLFRTRSIDPSGNTVTYGYDAQRRLTTVTDALGQVTTLSYGLAGDPKKVTLVTDPFGRTASMTYTASGLLESITDALGITTTFSYGPTTQNPAMAADFINGMTTPYGTSTFACGNGAANNTWILATDPSGDQERSEYVGLVSSLPLSDPVAPVGVVNTGHWFFNSYYWDKRAMEIYPGDYTKAKITHWVYSPGGWLNSVPSWEKKPLESRTWFLQAGQANSQEMGTISSPSAVLRILDDLSTQSTLTTYNTIGKPTQVTDPLGRVTSYVYSTDGIDLLEVHNLTGGIDDLLAKYTYNTQHKPLTTIDAAGQTTTFTYNGFGQILTITNPKSEVTTLTYDLNGYLQNVKGPLLNAGQQITTFTYDLVGRVKTVTNQPDNYTLTYDYDNLDRRTTITYPDGTTEETLFDRLDAWKTKDRLGRWTVMSYNASRQLTSVQDPQGRITRLDWCGCGTLDGLTDPQGKITSWVRDIQGRVTGKIFPDLTSLQYAYDAIGRLAQRIDAKAQVTKYSYYQDNALAAVTYSNTSKPTPNVSYTYDGRFNRLATSTGGLGTTTYVYNPITSTPTLGAGRLASVTGPLANSTITYGYDALGRVTTRGINDINETRTLDVLGRMSTVANPLGTFTYTFDGPTNRLQNIALPNGQSTVFGYSSASGDKRLQSIQNQKANGTNISAFSYSYDANGQIQTWTTQADAQNPKVNTFTYDAVGQILSNTQTDAVTQSVLIAYGYGYDEAGNRTTSQINGATTASTFNNLNQLTGETYSATPMITKPGGKSKQPGSKTKPPRRSPEAAKRLAVAKASAAEVK
ncbi:MAG: hypothetical protein HXX12_08360 [Geothrix sp.]|uniref:hypothetical protein n=1 Tax=Geothrix sp. TaxID=1962974 RepID=UPI001842C09B|nr:hypothetical protein [Geothrix sp.]NWJ40971.1 hypothetical protein [Geothrix sp.]WIL21033.1 MAG: hypothetical protein QOZ81_000277 [Geothrix sp.]